jgi:hypothetical protein
MIEPTREQKLVMVPVLCQLLVEFIEDTEEGGPNVYRQQLKYHAKGLIQHSDKFLEAVYGYAKTIDHASVMAEDQNNTAIEIKKAIAEFIEI